MPAMRKLGMAYERLAEDSHWETRSDSSSNDDIALILVVELLLLLACDLKWPRWDSYHSIFSNHPFGCIPPIYQLSEEERQRDIS
mmetsp:Transcript_21468/g.44923  ORF Transcript_21468/g.44923 Transcript_21468/m.44923 type:complete len:85 (+) Transcript_21468:2499-2753(+)